MGNLLSSVLSGLNAAQVGMSTVQHNIANATTEGYSRQQVAFTARPGQATNAGFIGQGVDVTAVRRVYDEFLNIQVMQDQTRYNYLESYHSAMKQIDNLVADPQAGITPALQSFFGAMNSVATNPESDTARQTLIGAAQFVVNRFNGIDERMIQIAEETNNQIEESLTIINSFANQIANINGNIKSALAMDPNRMPNDLLDQRSNMVTELAKHIGVRVDPQTDGSINVFIGNGQSLVVDASAMQLRAVASDLDPSRLQVGYASGASIIPIASENLQGGKLGGYIDFREKTLEPARNALGRTAIGLATTLNLQNQRGIDLYGDPGQNIFDIGNPLILGNRNNGGDAQFSARIADVSSLTTSDYQLRLQGGNYSLLRLQDSSLINLGSTTPVTVDGFTLDLTSGTMADGDVFLIRPTVSGANDIAVAIRDTSRVAAALPMRTTAELGNTGNGKISAGEVIASAPLPLEIRNNVSIVFSDPVTFDVLDNTSGTTLAAGQTFDPINGTTVAFNGWQLELSGTPAAGDRFTVSSNTNGLGDNRNALLMAAAQHQSVMSNGTITIQGAYSQLVGQVGSKTHELDMTGQAQKSMLDQSVAAQKSVSGVNLDEEAATLMQYQRAYQAAARAMQVSNTLFETLLSSMPR